MCTKATSCCVLICIPGVKIPFLDPDCSMLPPKEEVYWKLNEYPRCGYGCSGAVWKPPRVPTEGQGPCKPAKAYCGDGGSQKFPWMVKCCKWNDDEGTCDPKKGYLYEF